MERVSITYVGLAVCADAQLAESDAGGARIATQQPMPVGTELEISIGDSGDRRRARVTSVSEVREAGMRLAFVEATGHTPPPEAAPSAAVAGRAEAEPTDPKPKRKKKKSE